MRAFLASNKAAGNSPISALYNPFKDMNSSKTREEVQAEFMASRKQVEAFMGEDSGSVYLSATPRFAAAAPAGELAATK